jgi:hypothetical protein
MSREYGPEGNGRRSDSCFQKEFTFAPAGSIFTRAKRRVWAIQAHEGYFRFESNLGGAALPVNIDIRARNENW